MTVAPGSALPPVREIPLPPVNLRFMREDDTRLVTQGQELGRLLFMHGLPAEGTLLDIGCGYGRLAIGLLHDDLFRGRYIGFDILGRHIGWCRQNLSKVDRRYRFVHLDALNERYNPKGTLDPDALTFPAPAGTVDLACAFSVFTHLYRPTIQRYLAEVERVLRPGGVAVTTWLLFDAARMDAVKADAASYPMAHQLDQDTLYSDPTTRCARSPTGTTWSGRWWRPPACRSS